MRIPNLPILFTLAFISFFSVSCNKRPKPSPVQVNWLSDDPLTIPFRVRKQKFEKGNLVWNSSFEKGKNLIVDSSGVTFRIDGWQKVGNRVEWVNIETDSVYNKDEAFDSIRAVKIHRSFASETDDPGEGVMSDFIRVMPGNYQLSFHIRLNNIVPNRGRLGTRIFDAVNIKMIFFDKNKIEIKPKKYDPVNKVFFDNSFKGYSFSNFWKIKDMSWSRIIGKSSDLYLIDGDVPDDTRYVKLFFGLKGSGTMWIDMVDLRYSRENFSMLERMEQLMDTTLYKQETLIPTPKKVTKLASVPFHNHLSNLSTRPIILIPLFVAEETRAAARLIQSRIEELAGKTGNDTLKNPAVQIKSFITPDELNNSKLIFSIGKTDLYLRFIDILPDVNDLQSEQGYFIYTASDLTNIVFLVGTKPVGDFYAAATAYQLFDNRKLIFHNANIFDYPDFSERNICLNSIEDSHAGYVYQAALAKINGAYVIPGGDNKQYLPGVISETKRNFGNSSMLNFGIFQQLSGNTNIENGYFAGMLNLLNTENIERIVLIPDQKYLDNATENSGDCDMMRKLCLVRQRLKNIPVNSEIFVSPVWQNNAAINRTEGRAEFCLNELKNCFDNKTNYLWTGSSAFSMNTDNADLHRVTDIMNQPPLFWDNSTLSNDIADIGTYYPGKISLTNIFNPFQNISIKYLYSNLNHSEIFFNASPQSELGIIRMLSMADFAWNMNDYDIDFSVWKVLQFRYGLLCAKELVLFADVYANLLRNTTELKNPAFHQRLIRITDDLFVQLDNRLQLISGHLDTDHSLIRELKLKRDQLWNQFQALRPPQ